MKGLLLLSLLASILFSLGCNKENEIEVIMDSELTAYYWQLDSISLIGSIKSTIYNQDSGIYEGRSIVISFEQPNLVKSNYSSIIGAGTYDLLEEKGIKFQDFQRGDFSGASSEWFDLFVASMNDVDKYSIIDNQLSFFYENRRMHFTRL